MKIIDLIDGNIVISPEALCISPFSELWQKDKSKGKTQATKQIKYIWFYSDYNSPYFQHPESDRHNLILMDVLKDKEFEVTKEVKEGISKYKELATSPAINAVEAAFVLINKMHDYFKDVDLKDPSIDAKKIMGMFGDMPKVIASLNEAKKLALTEKVSGVKVRGDAELGQFE